jgi:hypothetical protein
MSARVQAAEPASLAVYVERMRGAISVHQSILKAYATVDPDDTSELQRYQIIRCDWRLTQAIQELDEDRV